MSGYNNFFVCASELFENGMSRTIFIFSGNFLCTVDDYQYLLGDITVLPQIMFLHQDILNAGHAFGASLFNVLRMCSSLRRLSLEFYTNSDLEVKLHLFIQITRK